MKVTVTLVVLASLLAIVVSKPLNSNIKATLQDINAVVNQAQSENEQQADSQGREEKYYPKNTCILQHAKRKIFNNYS